MSRGEAGARWMGEWLRHRRGALGLSRRSLVRSSHSVSRPLTMAIVQDLERGDRLPTLARIPALAKGLDLRPWIVSELARLAPRVEIHWRALATISEFKHLLREARSALYDARFEKAAAAAELSLRTQDEAAELRVEAQLLLASALWPLGHLEFARRVGSGVWELAELASSARSAVLLAEVALGDARHRAAEEWMLRSAAAIGVGAGEEWKDRLQLTRAEHGLATARGVSEVSKLVDIADRCHRRWWLSRRALECLVAEARMRGRAEDVRHWRQLLGRQALLHGVGSDNP